MLPVKQTRKQTKSYGQIKKTNHLPYTVPQIQRHNKFLKLETNKEFLSICKFKKTNWHDLKGKYNKKK